MTSKDSFKSRVTIHAGGRQVEIHRLDALTRAGFEGIGTLPYSIRVLLSLRKAPSIELGLRWEITDASS